MLDPFCRTHDIDNLFVVDASFFPSSAAVNPGLTIAAQALRVADHIKTTDSSHWSRHVKARSFSHSGITVSNFNRAVKFYWEVFGCPLVGVADTPPDRVRTFFGVDAPQPACKIGWVRVPGGGVLEIFEFQPQHAAGGGPVEPGRPDAHLLQRPQPAEVARLPDTQRGRVPRASRSDHRAATRSSSPGTSTAT